MVHRAKQKVDGLTRRDFLKSAALGAAAIAVGAYGINEMLKRPKLPTVGEVPPAPLELGRYAKEAYDYLSLGESVRCQLCPHGCTLAPGQRGVCRVRVNKEGKLYSLVYGNPAAVHTDPVEKKPLFHFLPGSLAYSIGTAGCNFRCLNCQNWEISQSTPEELRSSEMMPDAVVSNAINDGAKSVAYTYNEPVVFYEYMLDTARLARQNGLRNIIVSNGYIQKAPLDELSRVLDGAHIDLKGFDEDTYTRLNGGTLEPVLDTIKRLRENKVWFEVIHLAVPTWTDDLDRFREMAKWLLKNAGADAPLHISRFSPLYKLTRLTPTPNQYLASARKAAMEEGLRYVYVGNSPELELEDTICPKCGKVVVGRRGFAVTGYNLQDGACKYCGQGIAGVWS